GREHSLSLILADSVCLAAGLALTRGGILRPGGFPNSMLYRLTVWLPPFCSYFQLRHILPAVSERTVDGDLLALDLRVFHVEPAVAWDKFVTPITTEWFAFFYFGYFLLLSIHVLAFMLAAKSQFRLAHFACGIFMVFCTGHLIYTLVPGYGPYHFLAGTFQHELSGGPFWHAVQATVSAGGALKDIFPSLHTACPTYFALFSFRYRKVAPFKYTWIVTTFCALQIIVATMFLRWHYLIDIVAGITLAIFAVTVSEALVVRDAARRERLVRDLGPDAVHANFDLLDFSWAKRALGMGRVQGDGEGEERAG
ncbi:MAG: phosphatase PAP2 family protein, partial [Polyangiaceae bacterium]